MADDAREFRRAHAAVDKFVRMRGTAPDQGEPFHGAFPFGTFRSLHVGSGRGATLWDQATDCCWLLAYDSFHQVGHADDAYNTFNALYEIGELVPTVDDWVAVTSTPTENFADQLRASSRALLELARANPGVVEVQTWEDGATQFICVDVLVEGHDRAEQGWIGLTLPANEALADADVYALVVEVVPDDVVPTYTDKFKDRSRRPGEIVFTWSHYEEI